MTRTVVALLVAVGLAACTGGQVAEVTPDQRSIEVFGNFRGVDAEGMDAVLDGFQARSGVLTRYYGTSSFSAELAARLVNGDPPDVAIIPQPGVIRDLALRDLLVPLPEEVEDALDGSIQQEMGITVVDGRTYGVWFRAIVKSLVWYHVPTFEAEGYPIPQDLDDLSALVGRIRSDGYTPWCLSIGAFDSTGWVLTDWVEDLILARGVEDYDAVYADGGDLSHPAFRGGIDDMLDTLAPDDVAGGRRRVLTSLVEDAQAPMFDAEPSCLLHRQGTPAEGWLPEGVVVGEDTDFFPFPSADGADRSVLVGGEIAVAFDDGPDSMALLRYLAEPSGTRAWEARGGFIPAVPSGEPAANEVEGRQQALLQTADAVRFDGSDSLEPSVGTGQMWEAMRLAYAEELTAEEAVEGLTTLQE